jgi:cytochrome c biogenesis protein CcdA
MASTTELWGLVLLAGFLSFLSPCVLPLAPAYLAALTIPEQKPGSLPNKVAKTLAFAVGVIFPFFLIGLWAESWLKYLDNQIFLLIGGIVATFFGAKQTIKSKSSCSLPLKPAQPGGFLSRWPTWSLAGSFALGLISSFGWTSCSVPLLGAIMALAAGRHGLGQAAVLLTLFGVGVTGPFFILSLGAHGLSRKLYGLSKFQPWLVKLGGVTLMGLGVWLIWDNHTAITLLP